MTYFALKFFVTDKFLLQVDIGMAADVGALQRLPKIVGSDSFVREFCYTARKLLADEALKRGLVSEVYPDKDRYMQPCHLISEKL